MSAPLRNRSMRPESPLLCCWSGRRSATGSLRLILLLNLPVLLHEFEEHRFPGCDPGTAAVVHVQTPRPICDVVEVCREGVLHWWDGGGASRAGRQLPVDRRPVLATMISPHATS
ncbi:MULTISPECIES: hypothetical protein [Brachybacterium]|uniref:Uncharacterized protein n=1 Tax=Brachybacterium rhamnosum TaxID=173361 RepID=A0ABW4Q053_9MICO|nr:hypothetical protein [Brachybacterium squillarum]MCW1804489.1 hypothetical protein [Brachybacterium squillarum]